MVSNNGNAWAWLENGGGDNYDSCGGGAPGAAVTTGCLTHLGVVPCSTARNTRRWGVLAVLAALGITTLTELGMLFAFLELVSASSPLYIMMRSQMAAINKRINATFRKVAFPTNSIRANDRPQMYGNVI